MLAKMEENSLVKESSGELHYQTELKKVFGDIISNIIIRCFFGGEGTTATIDGISINKYLSVILNDAREQSTDLLVLLLGENAYKWGVASKYRELTSKLHKIKAVVKAIIDRRKERLLSESPSLDKYTDIFEAMWVLRTNGQKQFSPLEENELIE
jgi:hypothetical protein